MAPSVVEAFLMRLYGMINDGVKVFAHNGTGFDWQLLARITGRTELCKALCLSSYDLCFQMLCTLGYPIGIQAIAEGFKLPDKEMSGGDAPIEWHAGNYDAVRDYVVGDVLRLEQAVLETMRKKAITWRTKKGGLRSQSMTRFLTVEECLALPLPDTSWMDKPIEREDVISWILS
jgi:hypothetical protein